MEPTKDRPKSRDRGPKAIVVRVGDQRRALLAAAAAERGVHVSDVVREALDNALGYREERRAS